MSPFVAACLVALFSLGPNTYAAKDSSSPRVREFLETWLVSKDVERALAYFSDRAFGNEIMLSES